MTGFDHTHYVPVLRWKQAERGALNELDSFMAARMTPLIELVPRKKGKKNLSVDQILSKTAKEISENWGQHSFFVDLWHLQSGLRTEYDKHPLEAFGEKARNFLLYPIPVTGLSRNLSYQEAVLSLISKDHNGTCIRLLPGDLNKHKLNENLGQLLEFLSLCLGDKYIEEMGLQFERTGSAMTWLRTGINHHLTLVVNQIANLFGVSIVDEP